MIRNVNLNQRETVFQMNSNAVAALQQGNYDDAIAKLSSAMGSMRALVRNQHGFELMLMQGGYGSQIQNEIIQELGLLSVPGDLYEPSLNFGNNTDQQPSFFELFDKAFITIFLDYQGTRGVRLTCAFLLYNLGLCYHRREVNGKANERSPEHVRAALSFYDGALRMLNGFTDDGKPDDMAVLLLAIFNNMGDLCARYGDMDGTRYCISWIRNLLSTHEAQMARYTHGDIAFFFQNSLFFVDNIFEKAAAA